MRVLFLSLAIGITPMLYASDPVDPDMALGLTYHASGRLSCVSSYGGAAGLCPFTVFRTSDGSGRVMVTRPDGVVRTLYFSQFHPTGFERLPDDHGRFVSSRGTDESRIGVGDERYDVPDQLLRVE
ncbi:hypothetical protein ACTSKR_01035 [Chitinibacteraceae bacterium HSL-7]